MRQLPTTQLPHRFSLLQKAASRLFMLAVLTLLLGLERPAATF